MNTFIFGLDGASPRLIKRWIEEDHLPNLGRINRDGLHGELKSTFPPLTGPAWSSFQTGVNPGKHGVFNWLDLSDSYRGRVINSNSIRTKTAWELLGVGGVEVGLLSLPVTYPPREINGFVVPGFLTPDGSPIRSHPPELAEELEESVPGFEYYLEEYLGGSKEEWVSYLKEAARRRGEAGRFLVKNRFLGGGRGKNDRLLMAHFFATDLVQHYLWDEVTDEWDPRLEVFKAVDREIGKLVELAPEGSTFIIVSDHGFGPVDRLFNVNNWLREEGYLKLKQGAITSVKEAASGLGFNQRNLKPLGEKVYRLLKGSMKGNLLRASTHPALKHLFLSESDVDWEETSAYSKSDIGHVRLNLEGREERGTVNEKEGRRLKREIAEKLRSVEAPESSAKLFNWVKPKEEVYSGPSLSQAPDILFSPLGERTLGLGAQMFVSGERFTSSFKPGNHRRNGILMASGPNVGSGRVDGSITDIAPTLLNLFSQPIPEQMDGEVLRKIAPGQPTYGSPKDFYRSRGEAAGKKGGRKRLENLGYL